MQSFALGSNQDVVDGDVDELYKKAQETQHNEADSQGNNHALQLCKSTYIILCNSSALYMSELKPKLATTRVHGSCMPNANEHELQQLLRNVHCF